MSALSSLVSSVSHNALAAALPGQTSSNQQQFSGELKRLTFCLALMHWLECTLMLSRFPAWMKTSAFHWPPEQHVAIAFEPQASEGVPTD